MLHMLRTNNIISYLLEGPENIEIGKIAKEVMKRPGLGPNNYMDMIVRELVTKYKCEIVYPQLFIKKWEIKWEGMSIQQFYGIDEDHQG